MAEEKAKNPQEILPEGMLINHALFKRDAYKDKETGKEGAPLYKAEVAIKNKHRDKVLQMIEDAAEARWPGKGGDAVYNEEILLPLLDGDELADDREERGKQGDAYRGCFVIRSNTAFNKDGEEGPGGSLVIDEDTEELDFDQSGEIYSGCKVRLKVAISFFPLTDKRDKKDFPFGYGCKLYLVATQKTGDGEKLFSGGNAKEGFEKVGRSSKKRRDEIDDDEDERPRKRRRREEPEDEDEEDDDPKPRRRRR